MVYLGMVLPILLAVFGLFCLGGGFYGRGVATELEHLKTADRTMMIGLVALIAAALWAKVV